MRFDAEASARRMVSSLKELWMELWAAWSLSEASLLRPLFFQKLLSLEASWDLPHGGLPLWASTCGRIHRSRMFGTGKEP
jgi:hypothetical protein